MGDDDSGLDIALSSRIRERGEVEDAEEFTFAVLVFELGGSPYAVEGRFIKAVLPMTEPFLVPGCPPSLEGVILHQGEIESVIDISATIGLSPLSAGVSRAILLAQTPAMRSGIRVDRVLDVAQVPESRIAPSPQILRDALREMAPKVVEREGGIVPLLDLPAIFAAWERSEA
ncbi:MAG TPA: chemotaxis protein CheW [Rectinemataceae bacterium]|nr:chemotaxis protein CheW [Rectinemataceae bacterium]